MSSPGGTRHTGWAGTGRGSVPTAAAFGNVSIRSYTQREEEGRLSLTSLTVTVSVMDSSVESNPGPGNQQHQGVAALHLVVEAQPTSVMRDNGR